MVFAVAVPQTLGAIAASETKGVGDPAASAHQTSGTRSGTLV
jgi:hypothetical protein